MRTFDALFARHWFRRVSLLWPASGALLSIAIALLPLPLSGQQPPPAPRKNLYQIEKIFALNDTVRTISLADSFIIAGSERVWLNRRVLQRGRDYHFSAAGARVTLLLSAGRGDSLRVSYRRLPLPLQQEYALRRIVPAPTDSGRARPDSQLTATRLAGFLERSLPVYGADLQKSGSLTRGISAGTAQGLKVESGLRLQVSGKISNDVEVIAALSDQNLPIQPEGNTQTLREIDKVFIQIRAPHFNATLGDYELGFAGTEFARYRRKLQGASGTVQHGNTMLTLFGAVSRGKYNSMEFLGVEGKQGPYQLTGDRGQIDIIVLAGTERVWVDGELMVRGENNDYVIEYGNGQLTFTRRRLITGNSRITVDFQYSDERFERTLFGGEAKWATADDRLQVRATLLSEGDDKNDPLGISLTGELRAALEGAGDSLAAIDGAEFVGPGQGTYLKQDSIFVFVGVDSGDYRVRFSDFGPGNGSYSYTGFGRYIYVGPGRGRYEPQLLLPKAQRTDLADLRLHFSPAPSFKLTTEIALSRFDENLFSSQGDDDNAGSAYFIDLAYSPRRLPGLRAGKSEFRVTHRRRSARYREIDRTDVVEFGRRWDIESRQRRREEAITEAAFRLEPAEGMTFFGTSGFLRRGAGDIASTRWEAGTRWTRPKLLELDYRIEHIARRDSSSRAATSWLRQRGHASRLFWRFRPLVEFESEIREAPGGQNASFLNSPALRAAPLTPRENLFAPAVSIQSPEGFRFLDIRAGLGYEAGRTLRVQAKIARRTDDKRTGSEFLRFSTSNTKSFAFTLQNGHGFNTSASYIHRTRDFTDSLALDTRTDLAEVRLNYSNWQRALQADLRYQITNAQTNRLERVFLRVNSGDGNYRFDEELGEFVDDPFGDFVLRLVPTEDFIPVADLRSRVHVRLRPHLAYRRERALSGWQRILSAISSETLLRIEEKTRDPNVRDIYLLKLSRFQSADFTLFGTINLTQDFYIFENRRDFSLRYRLVAGRDMNNQFVEGGQERRQLRHELRLNLALAQNLAAQFQLAREKQDRIFVRPGRADRRIRSLRLEGDFSYRPQPRFELALLSVFGRERDIQFDPATRVLQYTFKPRMVYAFRGTGQLRGEIEYTYVQASPAGRVLPFELAQGNRPGTTFRWNLSFIYRVSTNLQASFSYQGRNEPHRPRTLHIAKAEVRAFF